MPRIAHGNQNFSSVSGIIQVDVGVDADASATSKKYTAADFGNPAGWGSLFIVPTNHEYVGALVHAMDTNARQSVPPGELRVWAAAVKMHRLGYFLSNGSPFVRPPANPQEPPTSGSLTLEPYSPPVQAAPVLDQWQADLTPGGKSIVVPTFTDYLDQTGDNVTADMLTTLKDIGSGTLLRKPRRVSKSQFFAGTQSRIRCQRSRLHFTVTWWTRRSTRTALISTSTPGGSMLKDQTPQTGRS